MVAGFERSTTTPPSSPKWDYERNIKESERKTMKNPVKVRIGWFNVTATEEKEESSSANEVRSEEGNVLVVYICNDHPIRERQHE